jgi:hypothetical protein
MIMGLIREANHEVNGSLATYNIDDHSGGLLEIKWWHDVSFSFIKNRFSEKKKFNCLGFR